jgi:hypothetical protein
MYTGAKAIALIQNEFPLLCANTSRKSEPVRLFQLMQRLADYAKEQLADYNDEELEHCFEIANEIYASDDKLARIAICTVFVQSVSRKLEMSLSVSARARKLFLKFFKKQYEDLIESKYP